MFAVDVMVTIMRVVSLVLAANDVTVVEPGAGVAEVIVGVDVRWDLGE